MTLVEYLHELRKEVIRFEEYWAAENELDPVLFPLNMPQEEWDEQHLAWLSLNDQ